MRFLRIDAEGDAVVPVCSSDVVEHAIFVVSRYLALVDLRESVHAHAVSVVVVLAADGYVLAARIKAAAGLVVVFAAGEETAEVEANAELVPVYSYPITREGPAV